MKIKDENKMSLIVIIFIIVLLLLIIVPLLLLDRKNQNEKYFSKYKYIDITESKLNDPDEDDMIRKQLENDYYYSRLVLMDEYDSEFYENDTYGTKYLQDMVYNFIFNYELENTKNMTINHDLKSFCMNEDKLIDAFKELYSVDIKDDLNMIPGYYKYVYKSNKNYCFYYNEVINNNTSTAIGVEKLSMNDNIITSDIYLYKHNSSDNESLKTYIKQKDYISANNYVKETLKGKVSHKQLKFKLNKNGKYFKYQLLSIKSI